VKIICTVLKFRMRKFYLSIILLLMPFLALSQDRASITRQIAELETKKTELLTKYTENSPQVVELNQQIEKLYGELNRIKVAEASLIKLESLTADDIKVLLEYKRLEAERNFCSLQAQQARCNPPPAEQITAIFREAAKRPTLARGLIGLMLSQYDQSRLSVRSAPQASQLADEVTVDQNFIIISQNQRIIELLEQLVKKK
jgi:hypothetical protein